MEQAYLRRIYWQLTGIIMTVMLAALLGISYFSHQAFQRALVPEIARKAETVGASVRALIDKAMGYGITFDRLYGADQALKQIDDDNPDISYLALTDATGKSVADSGRRPAGAAEYFLKERLPPASRAAGEPSVVGGSYVVSMRVEHAGEPFGALHIGIAEEFVRNTMLEALFDLMVVLVVALFFTLELLNFLAGAPLASGLHAFASAITRVRNGDFAVRTNTAASGESAAILGQIDAALQRMNAAYRDIEAKVRGAAASGESRYREAIAAWESLTRRYRFGQAADVADDPGAMARVRAPLFTFILAEESTRSYLPAYIAKLMVPLPGISPQVVIGLPIVMFMLIVALGQPFLGAWSERVGRRRAMTIGAALGTVGFVGTAFAFSLYDLLFWRALCGLSYAIVFVAAQGYILDHAQPHERAQGFALFVGAIMVATICGPPIGGILADNIGSRMAFGVGAALCALSILAMRGLPDGAAPGTRRPERPPTLGDFFRLMLNGRFMTLTGLAAMPAKIILTGVCFYLVPLYIVSIGSTQAMAGRVLMVYAVMMVLIAPIAARVSDRGAKRESLVAAGLLISGLGGLLLLAGGSFIAVFGVVFAMGLGQALSIASQSALVGDLCKKEVERFGDGSVYGVYRMLERFGNALGPLIAGVLVLRYGYEGSFVGISVLVLVCGLLFALLVSMMRREAAPAGATS